MIRQPVKLNIILISGEFISLFRAFGFEKFHQKLTDT